MVAFKRKRYFIKREFQLRYAAIVSGFILLSAVISSLTTYFAIFPYLSQKLANVYPQGRLMVVLKNANMKALLSTLVVLPFAAWFSMFLSHRIAGPWYRLEQILSEVAEGNLTSKVNLRKGDELQSLADAINIVTSNLKEMGQENRSYLASLDESLADLEQELGKDAVDPMKAKLLITKIQDMSKELKGSLQRHRIE